MDYDVIIVGASISGLCVAHYLLKKGYKVLLLDLKTSKRLGESVSGDIMRDETVLFLKENFDIRIPKLVIEHNIDMLNICCFEGSEIDIASKSYVVNKNALISYLLGKAMNYEKFEFLERYLVAGVEENNKKFVALKVQNMNTSAKSIVQAKVFVDASGPTAVLRRSIPENRFVQNEIEDFDRAVVYEETLKLANPIKDTMLIFDPTRLQGGSLWLIPKKDNCASFGIGIPGLPSDIKKVFLDYKKNMPELSGAELVSSSSGVVPHRRPLNSLVFKNIVFVGGAACQVNPLITCYMDYGIKGAYYASKAIDAALKKSEINTESLWSYNSSYMKDMGSKSAIFECIRDFFTSLNSEEFNFIIEKKIVPAKLMERLEDGLRNRDILFNSAGLLLKPRLIHKFVRLVNYSKGIRKLYNNYEEYSGFLEWKNNLDSQISKVRESFMI